MFETKKIDSFFSGEKNLLDEEEKIFISKRTKIVRFLKLFLPCLTALLMGLGVILFDFENNQDVSMPINEEDRIYFEKFRMKNSVFEITEKDNRFSVLKADVVEEIEPNSKIYNLSGPVAQSFDKDNRISLSAQKGVYDQQKQSLDLSLDVVAHYNQDMTIKTNSVNYNFSSETGFGNDKIVGSGTQGYFSADSFKYDKKKGIIHLIKNVYLKGNGMELRSPEQAIFYQNENKFTSTDAVFHKGEDIIQGDTLTVFFKDTQKFEITKAYSQGHTAILAKGKQAFADRGEYDAQNDIMKLFDKVVIIDDSGYKASADEGTFDNSKQIFTLNNNVVIKDKRGNEATAQIGIYDLAQKTFTLRDNVHIKKGKNIITSPKAVYFQAKNEFRLYDDVKIEQEDGVVTAKNGVYYIKKNLAELNNDVIITKKGNQVRGDKAIADFATSKSRLIGESGKRVFGKLFESTFLKKGN